MVVEVMPRALACTKREGVVDPPGPPIDAVEPATPDRTPPPLPPGATVLPADFSPGEPGAVADLSCDKPPTTSDARSPTCLADEPGRAITAAIRTTNATTPAEVIHNSCAETPRRSRSAFNTSVRVVR